MGLSVKFKEDMYIPIQFFCRFIFGSILAFFVCAAWRITIPLDSSCSISGEQGRSFLEHVSYKRGALFLPRIDFKEVSSVSESDPVLASDSMEHLHRPRFAHDMYSNMQNIVIESQVCTPNDPVAWYKFDGNANDSTGSAHGRLCGSPTYASGVYGQAISFDGYRDSVQMTNVDNLFSNIRTGITITFWQYGKTSKHHRDTLCCSNYIEGIIHPAIAVNIGCWKEPGEYNWDCGQLGSHVDRLTGKHQNDSEWSGRWNHWAFTKDARNGRMQVFLNGELFDSRTKAFLFIPEITSFEIGSGWYGGYDGLIDDFRIYNYALSLPEIAYIATNGTGLFDKPRTVKANLQSDVEHSPVTCMGQKFVLKHQYQTQGGNYISIRKTPSANSSAKVTTNATSLLSVEDSTAGSSKSSTLILKPDKETNAGVSPIDKSGMDNFANGEDILEFDLPETMTLIQLLDFLGEYLDLDCVYDPDVIGKHTITLKLSGSLKGKMRIKDLYTLLQTVLKFDGLAMTRRGDKLLSVVPVSEALEADPRLIIGKDEAVQAGDIVVTRMFKLQYVNVTSVEKLLESMKLGVALSSSEDAQILFVTCYAHRMSRIEQLVNMLDRPGKARECRFRRLQYTVASTLAEKVRPLAQEIQGIPVMMVSAKSKGSSDASPGQPVYLDTDERTNRLVMIGHEEQLEFLEKLVDVLDVNQEDLRTPKTYNIKNMTAQEVLGKLQEFEVLGPSAVFAGRSRMGASGEKSSAAGTGLTEEPLVVVLEATNQLLIKATREQHSRIRESLEYIDVSPEDLRTLESYEIKNVDAGQVKTKLEELDVIGAAQRGFQRTTTTLRNAKPGVVNSLETNKISTAGAIVQEPQVLVNETTNSLLVNATTDQHARIATIIEQVDRKIPEEEISYKIYPLENSSPEHVADLIERLIQRTTEDKETKTEKILEKKEQITIVPDPNTFSLIAYASKKNQEWIDDLIKSLDKRRPQVLIDVTLVEITRTDTFEYDLNLVASADDAVIGNIGIEPIHRIGSGSRLEGSFNLPDQEGKPSGETKAFFSDEKVQALLTAIQRKNYGRILAKPKILVDDGQEGEIATTDATTYEKETIQIPNQGPSITTRDFEPIEAKIQLQITPHISEGDLLRLDVHLSREDFGTRPSDAAPPDKATSEVTTTVFVPDDNTVILGGLVKLNQTKGGSKVPILGDIPLIGALFRSVNNSDVEKKLYVFLKANMVRPYEESKLTDLQKISDEHRKTFEQSETEFQKYQDIPGIKPKPMLPERVLEEP